jgi:hypothetical protein
MPRADATELAPRNRLHPPAFPQSAGGLLFSGVGRSEQAAFLGEAPEPRPWALTAKSRPAAFAGCFLNPSFLGRGYTCAYTAEYPIPPPFPSRQPDLLLNLGDHRGLSEALEPKKCGRLQACSVGDRPTGVRVRNPVAWIAGGKETELLEPIDKAIFRMVSKSSGRNANKPIGDLEILRSEGRAPSFRAKAAWIVATDRRGEKLRRGGRDSTMTRAR